MHPKDAEGIANSVDPDQTALGAVWSGSALFAQTCLSQNLGILQYILCIMFYGNLEQKEFFQLIIRFFQLFRYLEIYCLKQRFNNLSHTKNVDADLLSWECFPTRFHHSYIFSSSYIQKFLSLYRHNDTAYFCETQQHFLQQGEY